MYVQIHDFVATREMINSPEYLLFGEESAEWTKIPIAKNYPTVAIGVARVTWEPGEPWIATHSTDAFNED
jgi:hypothetical protein